jgi:hypothetical protein
MISQRFNCLQDVHRVAAEPVEFPYHDSVTVAYAIQKSGQPWTVVSGARHVVGERLCHAHRSEGSVLLFQRLGDGADPCVTYERSSARRRRCTRITQSHNRLSNIFETVIPETDF